MSDGAHHEASRTAAEGPRPGVSFAARPLILAVRLYQAALGPFMGGHCRFHPTCSAYAIEALETHGALRGGWLGLRRLLRCHPLGRGGYDPVPERTTRLRSASRASRTAGRRIAILAALLLGGLLVNAGVAWSCVVLVSPGRATPALALIEERAWWYGVDRRVGFASCVHEGNVFWEAFRPDQLLREGVVVARWSRLGLSADGPLFVEAEQARGWPWLSFWSPLSAWDRRTLRYVDPSWTIDLGGYVFPLCPIWPGFLANTIAYGGALALLTGGRGALRRFVRVRRGVCPACGYPAGRGPLCTECGASRPVRETT